MTVFIHIYSLNLSKEIFRYPFNPLNAEVNPICHLLALLGAHHILHVSKIRVKYQENCFFIQAID